MKIPEEMNNSSVHGNSGQGEKTPYLYALLVGAASVLLILLLSSLQLDILRMPLRGDNGMYFFVSERVASGGVPYQCHFDPKTSLSLLITGLVIAGGRLFDVPDIISARLFYLFLLGFAAAVSWLTVWRLSHSRRASTFAALGLFSSPGFVSLTIMSCRPKSFVVVFVFLAMLAFFHRKHLLSALFISLGFLCWQPVFMFLPVLVVLTFLRERKFGSILAVLVIASIPIVLYEFYFALMGNFSQQIEQAFIYPYTFMSGDHLGVFAHFRRFVRSWSVAFGPYNILNLAFPLGVVVIVYTVIRRFREGMITERTENCLFLLLSTCLAFSFTLYSHQGFPDLFLVLPFVVIISALAFDTFVEVLSRREKRVLPRIALVIISCMLIFPTVRASIVIEYQFTLADQLELAEEVGDYIDDGLSVYAIGCTQLLAFNHVDNWLNDGYFSNTVNDYQEAKTGGEIFLPKKNGEWPSIILLSGTRPRNSEKWLRKRYIDITTDKFSHQKIRIFRYKKDVFN